MTVYVDEIFRYPIANTNGAARRVARRHGGQWCHLWCDPGDEASLHEIAKQIGMKRTWFQDRNRRFPHYDLVPTRRDAAIRAGAVEKDLREWMKERKSTTETTEDAEDNNGRD